MQARYHEVFHGLTMRSSNASQHVARIASSRLRRCSGAPKTHRARPLLDRLCQIVDRSADNASSEFNQIHRETDHMKTVGVSTPKRQSWPDLRHLARVVEDGFDEIEFGFLVRHGTEVLRGAAEFHGRCRNSWGILIGDGTTMRSLPQRRGQPRSEVARTTARTTEI
jgi:hypothetical protein